MSARYEDLPKNKGYYCDDDIEYADLHSALMTHDKAFDKNKTVILYCGSGGRAALGGKLLKDLGYEKVFNMGGFKDWVESGGPVEK